MVSLIRSKGVGVYFVTQNPLDIPESILGQLGNRIQHGLRAYTPKDQKAVKVAAQTFRQNPKLNAEIVITELGVGDALVSFLDSNGIPSRVEKIHVIPPLSRIGGINNDERKIILKESPSFGIYEHPIDRESAYEIIEKRTQGRLSGPFEAPETKSERKKPTVKPTNLLKGTIKVLNTKVAQQIMRGILGSIFGGKK